MSELPALYAGWPGYDTEANDWLALRDAPVAGLCMRWFDEVGDWLDATPNIDYPHPATIAEENGAEWITMIQQIGDCTSFGLAHAVQATMWYERFRGAEDKIGVIFPPYVYGWARQIYNDFSGDGVSGSAVAKAAAEHGFLTLGDPGVPKYSGELARKWGARGGHRHLRGYESIAKKRTIGHVRCKTITECMEMLSKGCGLTVAEHRGFEFEHEDGEVWAKPSRLPKWSHQWAVVYADDRAVYACNSHQNRKSWLMTWDVFDYVLKNHRAWVEAIVTHTGDDGGDPDWSFA